MRAVGVWEEGAPLRLLDVPVPGIAADEVLVRVQASSINPADTYMARGRYRLGDLTYPLVPGLDVAGVIEAVGADVDDFASGDAVFGAWTKPGFQNGAWGEFVSLPVDTALVRRPQSLSVEQAAALPIAAITALLAVDAVAPERGETVLVVGAAGAVGNYTVQLAAACGARVLATARPADAERVLALGAAETIDYTTEDLAAATAARSSDGLPALFDLVQDRPALMTLAELVTDGGRVASARFAADRDALAERGIAATNVSAATVGPEALARLVELLDDGRLSVMVSSVVPLEELPAAVEAFERGGRGKIVVSVA
jgi:NADPH:quinone reductase-like Zn-dependent oxidoreductase